ncbi:WD repeat-containing protein 74 [Aphelenchoides fujianensis]|nr:WD repeat-containing protein 74 [Aphelenchoides fujianensis]
MEDGADCFVGAATGAFKTVDLRQSRVRNVAPVETLRPKEHAIVDLQFADGEQKEVLALQRNGDVRAFRPADGALSPLSAASSADTDARFVGLQTAGGRLVTGEESGVVRVWTREGDEWTAERAVEAGARLRCLQRDPAREHVLATGGRDLPLKLWDLSDGRPLFAAKNVRESALCLQRPEWVAAVRFLADSPLVCTATGHHQLRLYDPRAQRRPVGELEWLHEPLTALAVCSRPLHVLAANTRGDLGLFDLRNKMRPVQKYRGFAGFVRAIAAHPTAPLVASVGIDRFLVVHELDSRRVLKKIYCKAKLNAVLLPDLNALTRPPKQEPEDEPAEEPTVPRGEEDDDEPAAVADFFRD